MVASLTIGNPPTLLEVRPLEKAELARVVQYFLQASPEDLERMGVDRRRYPAAGPWLRGLESAMSQAPEAATSHYLGWRVGGQTIGYAALKNLRYGERADIHLHMWSPEHRGRGFGPILFCLAVLEAYDRFRLRALVCEPKATNPMPNRMLAKIGFPLVRSYMGSSSELSEETLLNQYRIDRDVADAYLRRSGKDA